MTLSPSHGRVFLSSLLVVTLSVFVPQPIRALGKKQPVILKLIPSQAAAGFGQLVTIQGFNLYDPARPTLTQANVIQGGVTAAAFVFPAPSNPNEVYVRLPTTLSAGAATVTVKTTDDNLVSAPFPFTITATPAAPVARNIVSLSAGFPVITSAARGSDVGIQAYGMDTSGATAVFTQGTTQVPVASGSTFTNPAKGVIGKFTVPSTLTPGTALVQIRVAVNGVASDSSFALLLTIT